MVYEYLDINGVKIPLPLSAFPVGSIYMSVDSASPASFIGGTWTRIENKFLLAAGSSYSAGSEGGRADAVIPDHNHAGIYYNAISDDRRIAYGSGSSASDYYMQPTYAADGGSTNNFNSGLVKPDENTLAKNATIVSDATGKNMPPYLTVYVWKRVA